MFTAETVALRKGLRTLKVGRPTFLDENGAQSKCGHVKQTIDGLTFVIRNTIIFLNMEHSLMTKLSTTLMN